MPDSTADSKKSGIPSLRRLVVCASIGSATGLYCWFLMTRFHQGAGDFQSAIHLAQRLLARQYPYDAPIYPLTAALFGLPFVRVPAEIAAGLFWGISSFLLALGLTRTGYTRLLIFLAYPYWAGLLTVQWLPLIAASAFFPLLMPVTMAKPQVGLPIFITRFSRLGLWACIAVGLASLVVMPNWPLAWIRQASSYQHFFPILVLPGPLLLLALLRHRDRDALFLLLTAVMPQRWFYDSFILWLIPRSRREIVWTVFFSWGAGIWRWYHMPHSFTEVGRWVVIFLYLPMLAVVLMRQRSDAEVRNQQQDRSSGGLLRTK